MGFFDFLKPKWMRSDDVVKVDVEQEEFGFKSKHIEVECPSETSEKQGYWKVFYSPKERAYISRHGSDSDFENTSDENDWTVDKGFLYNMAKPEDYENIDPIFDKDYDDFYK